MKLTIALTPEIRVRLMYAETVEIDVPVSCVVPEGWQVVPVEPTTPMLAAFVEAGGKAISGYKAMLATAPKPDGGAI